MSYPQLFSSFLCIGFLFPIANGFFVISQPTVMIDSSSTTSKPIITNCDPYGYLQSRTDRQFTNLRATKGRSKASTAIGSSSDKIKEMASFLSVQLLEKVMKEAMNPEAEINTNLESLEKITEALQMNRQRSSKTSTTTSEATRESGKADDITSLQVETTKPNDTTKPTLSTPAVNTETKPDDAPLSTTEDDDTNINSKEIQSNETITTKVGKTKVVAPVPERVSSTPQTPEILRKPLEIIQSDIPPLRPESIPQKTNPTAENEQEVEADNLASGIIEEDTDALQLNDGEKKQDTSDEIVDTSPSLVGESRSEIENTHPSSKGIIDEANTVDRSLEEIDAAFVMERKKAEDLFRRRLLKQKFDFDNKKATRIENENSANLNTEKQIDVAEIASDRETDDPNSSIGISEEARTLEATPLEVDIESPTTEFAASIASKEETEEEEETHKGESTINDVVSEAREGKPESPDLTIQKPSPIISERRVETIVALRQPKSSEEEFKLAEKYAQMKNLEDRAYALLCDLGMVEERTDPRD